MKIHKIKLNNIRSFVDEEIIFPEGSILLSGDIGCGKTSILMAIEFALFGLQPGQRGNSLLRNGEVEGGVIIEFEIGEKQIIIERSLKKAKTISQDYCAITINNGKEETSVTELKSKVLDLLNYPKEFAKKQNILYKFTVYTPQEEMKQIILQDPETRINTLRHVFGIDKYKKILENASVVAAKIREEKRIKEAITANLEQDKLNLVFKEEELETKKKSLIDFENDLLEKRQAREKVEKEKEGVLKKIEEKIKLQQEIEKAKLMINNKHESLINNEKLIENLQGQIKELQDMQFDESKITQIEQLILVKKQEKAKLDQQNIEINSKISGLKIQNQEKAELEKKISNLEVCPTCLQDVDAVYRANVLNKARSDISANNVKIENLENEKKQVVEKFNVFDSEISAKEKELTDLKILKMRLQDLEDKQKRVKEIEDVNNILKKDIEFLKQHNENLNQSVFELGKYDNIFEEKKLELENVSRQERIADIKLAELKKEIEVFFKQIEELKEKVKQTEELKEKLNYLAELESWIVKNFSPVISFIEKNVMIKLKSEFSHLFAEWFAMLVSDSFNVGLDDKFTPKIELQDYEIDYAYLSGGERTAIALAYRLALNQVINSLLSKIKTRDLVILDEPTDGFSEQQLDKMREVLDQLNIKQLIIVSHEQKIEGFVENVVKFKKIGGISYSVVDQKL